MVPELWILLWGVMDKFLGELKTQYWYWFLRDVLIKIELEEIKSELKKVSLSKREKLEVKRNLLLEQIAAPTAPRLYKSPDMERRLCELRGRRNIEINLAKRGDKYKNGLRLVPHNVRKSIDMIVPGTFEAFERGPMGLFKIIQSDNFSDAIILLIREFLGCISKSQEEWKNDKEFVKVTEKLVAIVSMYSLDAGFALHTLETAMDKLFKNRLTDADLEILNSVVSGEIRKDQLDPIYLQMLQTSSFDDYYHEPSYMSLNEIAPIFVSMAFLKARYLNEARLLTRACFHRKYLKIMQRSFLMSDVLWFFDVKSGGKVEPSKSKSPVKMIFQRALTSADHFYSQLQDDWGIDLDSFRDNNGT